MRSNNIKHKFNCQKASAKHRGISWKLTFDEWLTWWIQSGHWNDRGVGKGKYVMARKGDQGAYELGNIECVTQEENISEAHKNKPEKSQRSSHWSKSQEISQGNSVMVEYIKYASVSGASRATGLRRDTIVLRIAKGFAGYQFL